MQIHRHAQNLATLEIGTIGVGSSRRFLAIFGKILTNFVGIEAILALEWSVDLYGERFSKNFKKFGQEF